MQFYRAFVLSLVVVCFFFLCVRTAVCCMCVVVLDCVVCSFSRTHCCVHAGTHCCCCLLLVCMWAYSLLAVCCMSVCVNVCVLTAVFLLACVVLCGIVVRPRESRNELRIGLRDHV